MLIVSGSFFSIILVIWFFTTFLDIPSGTVDEQLIKLKGDAGLYKISFFNASLISLPATVLMTCLALYNKSEFECDLTSNLGMIFLVPYITLVSMAYTSQYTFFIKLLNSDTAISDLRIWYFYDSSSIVYFLDLLGYVFFGLSAILIGFRYFKRSGTARLIGLLLAASGLTAFAGFAGYIIGNEFIEQFIIISGVLTLPLGISIIIFGKKLLNS